MNAFALIVTCAFALSPAAGVVRSAVNADGLALKGRIVWSDPAMTTFAVLERPKRRASPRPGHRMYGLKPFASRPEAGWSVVVADDLSPGREGTPTYLGRTVPLRC